MSTKKEPQIEKGIEKSFSIKRDVLIVPPGARGSESIHPAHLEQPQKNKEVKRNDSESISIDITELVRRKKEEPSSSLSPKRINSSRFEKKRQHSLSQKKKGKERDNHQGGGTRKKYKHKLRKINTRKRHTHSRHRR